VIRPSLPINTVQEFLDYARKNPGKVSYGSTGTGSSNHLSMELFKSMTGIDIVHVPYKGSAPMVNDLSAITSIRRSTTRRTCCRR
jgi:tripartite-type tricarboxylate transporter receptor subunit TctC